MNYHSKYGLEYNPFLKNSKDIIIETNDYKQIKYRLDSLLSSRGFGILTGEPGRGKTTVVRHWSRSLSLSNYKVVYTALSTLTLNEFYKHLASEFGLEPMFRKSDNYKNIQAEIERLAIGKKITPIFIFDEANSINTAILNELKLLFNFEMDSRDRAIVLLTGIPALNHTLHSVANESLRQRITMNYKMESLSKEEGQIYIKSCLKAAGCHHAVFSEAAMEAILNTANGVPRMINKICNMCLNIGSVQNAEIIDIDIVIDAANEVEIPR